MNFDIPIEPHTDTAQALYRLLRQVQNWAEETHPDKGIKSPLEQARYQVAMYGDLLPQIVWWNSVCAQVGALRGLPPGKKQIEQLLEAFRGGPQGKRGKQHGQMVQRRWNELKATGEHVTEKETEAAGAVPSAPFPYPAGYQEVGAAVEASTAIPPGNTLGRFVYPKVQGVLQESKPFSFSEINIAGKPAGLLLEDVDLYDIGKIQNAISVLRERRQDDPTTLMYVLISVPTAYQALKVGNTLGATHAETWLRQHALTQLKVTTTPTAPLMLKISAEPFDLDTCDDTLVPLEDSGAIPANDWYFPKPALFGMRDTPETRQGLQQLDELITSFVAGFTGWEQMYHREHGNQLESAEGYEARLQKLVSWLYARLCPKLQATLLKDPWPALPKVEMQPWAPAEDVEVKLDSVVEAPKAPIVGVDWGVEEAPTPLRTAVINQMVSSLLDDANQEAPLEPMNNNHNLACGFADRDITRGALSAWAKKAADYFERVKGVRPNCIISVGWNTTLNFTGWNRSAAEELAAVGGAVEVKAPGWQLGEFTVGFHVPGVVLVPGFETKVKEGCIMAVWKSAEEWSILDELKAPTGETEGMRKRRAAFSPPREELPDPLDPVLHNPEITGADTGMDEQAAAGASVIEPEPRVDVRETLGSLPLAAAGMFEPSTTWRDVIKAMEEHDANLAAVCARSFLREASTFTWEVVSSWAASQAAYDRFQERTGLRPTHVLVAGLRLLRAVQDWRNEGRTNPVEIPLDRRLTLALNDPPGRRELVDRPPTTDGIFLAHQRADGVFLTALDKPASTPEQ